VPQPVRIESTEKAMPMSEAAKRPGEHHFGPALVGLRFSLGHVGASTKPETDALSLFAKHISQDLCSRSPLGCGCQLRSAIALAAICSSP
jgi:hypothetical protein